jgi:mannosyltransferase OCH1-like enzyme
MNMINLKQIGEIFRLGNLKKQKNQIQKKISILIKLTKRFPVKNSYHSIIPLHIFQTWHTKNLPPLMNQAVNSIKENNPKFQHFLYDDDDCREFIKNNFDSNVLHAYDSLIPGAFKADLWRYCVLYKLGGIYIDIKYISVNNFKLINLTEQEHLVLDEDKQGIYNALLVALPGNNLLLRAINQIVYNVKHKFYGNSCLSPTGPKLLFNLLSSEDKKKTDMYHDYLENFNNRYIFYKKHIIFKSYDGYINEHNHNKKVDYYGNLWNQRKIYR